MEEKLRLRANLGGSDLFCDAADCNRCFRSESDESRNPLMPHQFRVSHAAESAYSTVNVLVFVVGPTKLSWWRNRLLLSPSASCLFYVASELLFSYAWTRIEYDQLKFDLPHQHNVFSMPCEHADRCISIWSRPSWMQVGGGLSPGRPIRAGRDTSHFIAQSTREYLVSIARTAPSTEVLGLP